MACAYIGAGTLLLSHVRAGEGSASLHGNQIRTVRGACGSVGKCARVRPVGRIPNLYASLDTCAVCVAMSVTYGRESVLDC